MLKKILNKFLKKSDKGQEVQVEPEKILYQSSNRLKGKNAIIIGGGKGIGKAIATRFAEEGAKIIINSRSKTDLERRFFTFTAEFRNGVVDSSKYLIK